MVVLQDVRETPAFVVLLVLLERRETLEKMGLLAQTVPLVLRDWLVSVVLLVCPDNVGSEVSLVCLDQLESLESKEPQEELGTVDLLDLLDLLD